MKCDNGGEYTNYDFKCLHKNRGTVPDYTIPYTPQQNGKSDRLNRTIVEVEVAITMFYESDVNKE